jgi:alkylation response protein AidB-like acyl-CoA dehydrogenase
VRFAFTDDQLLFRDAVREFLAKECPPDAVRAAWERDAAHSPERWHALAELGVVGLTVPEQHGGLGMNELDLVLLLEESGRAALPEPLVEVTAVAAPLLAATGDGALAARWLPALATGDAVVTVAVDDPVLVLEADVADAMILAERDRIVVVDRGAMKVEPQPSIDSARRLFDVRWADGRETVIAEGASANVLWARARDRGALAAAAQLVGLADQMLALTVEYVKEREQFGVAVGSFQAVKHHLADALLSLEFARPIVYNAAYSLATEQETASRDASMAKCAASDAAALVARKALQCHGAIAYTVEYDLHLWMKRVWALSGAWGDATSHRRRVGESVLGPLPAN